MHVPTLSALRRRAGVAAVAAGLGAALLLAACGGGGGSTATPAATATTAATTAPTAQATTSSGGSSGGSTSGGATGGASALAGAFCGDWGKMVTQAALATGLGSSGATASGTATDMKTSIQETTKFVQALSDNAPSDIKADFQVYAQFWTQFAAAMEKANYDFTKVATDPTVQAAFESLNDPKFDQATQHIDAWVTQNCGG